MFRDSRHAENDTYSAPDCDALASDALQTATRPNMQTRHADTLHCTSDTSHKERHGKTTRADRLRQLRLTSQ
jgi:hypothetical protein